MDGYKAHGPNTLIKPNLYLGSLKTFLSQCRNPAVMDMDMVQNRFRRRFNGPTLYFGTDRRWSQDQR